MAKFNDIRELAQQNARWVSNSPKDWMNYLDVAARLYRYSFKDTLLIHAQRPDATACAELEVWNKKMNRWVNRGAKRHCAFGRCQPTGKAALCVRHCGHASGAGRQNADPLAH